ncbi:MAG: DUF465 domain-containing protein [Pseudomonadota bacterium]
MIGESHDLAEEFPEYRDRIATLRESSNEFAELYDDYQRVNKEVVRTGLRRTVHSDRYTTELKRMRLLHKDQLYAMLRA